VFLAEQYANIKLYFTLVHGIAAYIECSNSCLKTYFFYWAQKKVFWRIWVIRCILFHQTMEVNGAQQLFGYLYSSKSSSFVFSRRN